MDANPAEDAFVKEFHRRRERRYCLLSVILNSLIPFYWYLTDFDLVEHVRQNEELPLNLLIYVSCAELFKVMLVVVMYPLSSVNLTSLKERRRASVELGEETEEPDEVDCREIPKHDGVKIWGKDESTWFGKRDKDDEDEDESDELPFIGETSRRRKRKKSGRNNLILKMLEVIKGILCFALSVGGGHVLIILFGAPVLQDKLLTFQFSFIVTTWLFLPLCINILPATVIYEVLFMRFWDIRYEWVHRSQLRFIVTLFGAWCGAIAFPLDWDRPWQRWPVPCVVSVFVFYTIYHCLMLLYLVLLNYSPRFRRLVTFSGLNKVKVY